VAEAPEAPKGIFPWYAPGSDTFLGAFPLANDRVQVPGPDLNLQIEPEVGLACQVVYAGERVAALRPFALGAFNDCSIRRPNARKISDKKNWGAASKGVAPTFFAVTDLEDAASLRLACSLRDIDGVEHAYGVDSPLSGYSYYGDVLLDWIVERLANQKGADGTPLEDVGALMAYRRPPHALIGIGATRYTELGETTFLQPGDQAVVKVYDADTGAASVLRQSVVSSGPQHA
jgi:hypothetical protein